MATNPAGTSRHGAIDHGAIDDCTENRLTLERRAWPAQADVLLRDFHLPDFYLSGEGIQAAIRTRTMFNLLDVHSGDTVDFWLLTSDDFDRSRFARRRRQFADILRMDVNVSSPEDTILAKLRWAELSGGSEKQFNDALRVYEVQYSILDSDYLNRWAALLGIEPLLSRLQREAEPA